MSLSARFELELHIPLISVMFLFCTRLFMPSLSLFFSFFSLLSLLLFLSFSFLPFFFFFYFSPFSPSLSLSLSLFPSVLIYILSVFLTSLFTLCDVRTLYASA